MAKGGGSFKNNVGMDEENALRFESIVVNYRDRRLFSFGRNNSVQAVQGVSMTLERGTIAGIVGENGSGKSSLLKALCRFIPIQGGRIFIEAVDVTELAGKDFFPYRRKVQMIPQDFCDIFNPKMTVKKILAEPLDVHFPDLNAEEKEARILELLKSVELDDTLIGRLPSQLSGGQRQRISIARALAVNPSILICDEILSACDLYTQKQILLLLQELNRTKNLTILFVSHNMAAMAYLCHSIVVMRQGKFIAVGNLDRFFSAEDSYIQSLVDAVSCIKMAKRH
jgi:ABC-type glutathione transport system ATPase component